MAGKQRTWQIDWAGRHGTIHGAANAAGAVIAVASVAHWLIVRQGASIGGLQLATAGAVLLGVLAELVRGGVSKMQPPLVTVLYRIACWIGSGIWLLFAIARPRWTLLGVLAFLAVLAAGAAIAGAVAAMADDSTPGDPIPAPTVASDPEMARRNGQAEHWERIIKYACDGLEVHVPSIEEFDSKMPDGRPVGRTVQARCPDGRSSWKDIERHAADIENCLAMSDGCGIRVLRGVTRKDALIEVTEVNVLAEDQPYPNDYSALTIHEPLPMMTAPAGTVAGPIMREHCMGIFGEAGSGKTNTAQVVGVGVVRMRDALMFDLDTTGNRLSRPLLKPYVEGRTEKPAVFWAATDAREGWYMLRALQRAGYARNNGYGYLAEEADDDKCPISRHVPQLILRGDEIAHFASMSPDDPGILPATDPRYRDFPDLHELTRSIVFDQRWGGIRAILFGLRGTNEVVSQDIQSQLHALGVLKVTSLGEYRSVFTSNPTSSLEDARWPGCIQMRRSSTDRVAPYHVWRIKPSQLYDAAIACAELQPDLDELTALAMNGRDENGDPFDDLHDGELDILDGRWGRYFEKFKIERPVMVAVSAPANGTQKEGDQAVNSNGSDPYAGMAAAQSALDQAVADVQRRIDEANAASGQDDDEVPEDGDPVDPDAWADVMESWGAAPYVPPTPGALAPPSGWVSLAKAIIEASGPEGIGPQDILNSLYANHAIEVHRDTLHTWMSKQLAANLIHKPRRGKWAWGPRP
jgi:hypothetical protein